MSLLEVPNSRSFMMNTTFGTDAPYYMGNKENNVFKDALGVKGLGFKHHGNHPCNHGSHYGNHHGNYHDNHSNHHGNYHAEQLLFSCQCSKVSVFV